MGRKGPWALPGSWEVFLSSLNEDFSANWHHHVDICCCSAALPCHQITSPRKCGSCFPPASQETVPSTHCKGLVCLSAGILQGVPEASEQEQTFSSAEELPARSRWRGRLRTGCQCLKPTLALCLSLQLSHRANENCNELWPGLLSNILNLSVWYSGQNTVGHLRCVQRWLSVSVCWFLCSQ